MGITRVAAAAIGCWVVGFCTGCDSADSPYVVETLVAGSPMKGVHGLAFDGSGALHAVSLTGRAVYRVDIDNGTVETIVGPPDGVGDDLAFGPDGSLAWTALDRVLLRTPRGEIRTVAEGIDGLNSINFGPDGRLFFTVLFRGDALYEADVTGMSAPRLIAEKLGGLNGFEVRDDGKLIGPLFFGNAIVSVDIETGAVETITQGIQTPAAVNLLSDGDIIALGYRSGHVVRIDPKTGVQTPVAALVAPIDNLAIDSNDRVYISHSSFNGITELDPVTGATKRVVWGELSAPAGLTMVMSNGREMIVAADAWSHRSIDPLTGVVTILPAGPGVFGSNGIAADDARIVLTNISPAGMVQVIDRATGNITGTLFGFGAPYGVLTTTEGFLVVDYAADALISVGSGDQPTRSTIATQLGGPVGLARGEDQSVYITGHSDGTVSRVDLTTGARVVVASGLNRPEGLARLPDGSLAVAEVGARRLVLVNPSSGEITVAAEELPIGYDLGAAGPGLFTGVTADAAAAVYVTGDSDNSLIRLRRK